MFRIDSIQISPEMLALIAELDEFKGAWRSLGTLAPDRLQALRHVATIESIGSSTRIEGSKLTDREVERLLGADGIADSQGSAKKSQPRGEPPERAGSRSLSENSDTTFSVCLTDTRHRGGNDRRMTQARHLTVAEGQQAFYHCVTRCVRRAWLCGIGRNRGQPGKRQEIAATRRTTRASRITFAVRKFRHDFQRLPDRHTSSWRQ